MNFGTKIAISVAVFVVFILVLSLIMISKQTESVEKDYYEKDLRYEEEIQAQRNASEFPIKFYTHQDTLWVQFEQKINYEKGEISFFRPDNSKKDFVIPLNLDNNARQFVYAGNLAKGLWKVQVKWQDSEKKFQSRVFEWLIP
ncbi:FixH family protein [Raineya orbicola]|nr:FixH family protein [Raineya orbicola]